MTTAIVGVGNIGSALARHLVAGGEPVVLAARDESRAQAPPYKRHSTRGLKWPTGGPVR
jgi:predicted dinucleotide-binding enzyme